MRKLKILCCLVLSSVCFETLADTSFEKDIKPFLKDYCIRCHGPEKQKGDRRYDDIKPDFQTQRSAILWRDILDQLVLEEMPPKKPFPQSTSRKKIVDWITANFNKVRAENSLSKNGTVMRRLSHTEYTNSLKDLFNIDFPNFNLTRGLSDDNIVHGFDTDAKQLKATPYLFAKYLEIADRFIEKALPEQKPINQKKYYSANLISRARDSRKVKEGKKTYLDMFGKDPEASRVYIREAVSPADAYYKVKIKAQAFKQAVNWKKYRCPKPGVAWKLKVLASSTDYGPVNKSTIADYYLTTLTITEKINNLEFEVYLRKGFQLVFYWENGGGGQPLHRRTIEKEKKQEFEKFAKKNGGVSEVFNKFYAGPRLRVHGVQMNGPYFKTWPPAPVAQIFGKTPPLKPTMEFIKQRMRIFASKAWRRPPTSQELAPINKLIQSTISKDGYRAVAKGMKAIICSPSFLYHYQNKGKLDNFALASRLSYFLWGTSPDVQLLKIAYQKKLTDPKVYSAQVARLLKSSKVDNMINSFSYQWLHLKGAEEMPPDEKKFKRYYAMNVDKYMVQETQGFLKYLVKNNLSIYNCLDSNFAMLNESMAKFYNLKGVTVKGNNFRVVKLPQKGLRGGLLTQASVLTATSNGVDTSPIVRGVWVLENILGVTPPTPPADIEPLEPDIRGTKSVKSRLTAHREKESCNECHRKIDYLGLTLENFDPIGQWRTHYDKRKKVKVDSSAKTPTGSSIGSVKQLKQFLMQRKEQFARALTTKLLAYGTGREISYLERTEIDHIVKSLKGANGFRDLLTKVVNSKIFLNK